MELPFNVQEKRQMILFMGIQASGKTTFYKSVLAPFGYGHINLDTLHTRNRERELLLEYIKGGGSFVVDNTNPEYTDRERYVPGAKANGYKVIGIFFQSVVRDCIARNEQRESPVPIKAIPSTQKRMQFPKYGEGFDYIYFARITDTGFDITEWRE